ncbi:MAG: ribosome small subunit-dependent GTPase A [Clostridia bacterium]|nr:ribosome small subunit-dependent GTPase A [Clostridia bacterium]
MDFRSLNLGFTENLVQEAALCPDFYLGRVIAQYKDLYKIATKENDILACLSGKLRYSSEDMLLFPSVGDFVLLDRNDDLHGNAVISQVLKRKSLFVRRAAGTVHCVQAVSANIDTAFICMSLNSDFNLRRLERYLSITWDSGASPVIVLTKADLCENLPFKLSEIDKVASGVELVVTSSITEDGYKSILKYVVPGKTIAFMGSSGVGKSSLINRLLGEDVLTTREIRKDDKGRHATTNRELFLIPFGGAVIDTPGMRELGVENVNLSKTFSDIEEFAEQCRFKDCRHESEPGCAVLMAIEEGQLDKERLISYKKLKKEAKYEGLNSKQIDKEKIDTMFSDFDGIKNARAYAKSKNTYE